MKYNKPLIAALIGALSTVPAELFSRLLLLLDIGQYSIYQVDSLILTLNRPNTFLGFYVNVIVGGLTGMIFYYLLRILDYDYLVYKSIFVGMFASILSEVLLSAMVEGSYIGFRPVDDYVLHVLSAMVFGLSMGVAFQRFLIPQKRI